MQVVLTYRGRAVTDDDVVFIRELCAREAGASRRTLSKKLCAAWNWVQQNGAPRDMVCRGLMLALERGGHIKLPPVRMRPPNPLAKRALPATVQVDRTPVQCGVAEIGPLELRQVRRSPDEALFNGLMQEHHYLGYTQPVGEHLKHLVLANGRPVAALAWSSAPRHLGPRDRYIGWSMAARRHNISLLAYNTRFLIMPWVRVPHLASRVLSLATRALSLEWNRVYGHPIVLVETFVDCERFLGTCYRAANWQYVGQTTGRGKDDLTHRPTRSKKDVLVLPLRRDFRAQLSRVR